MGLKVAFLLVFLPWGSLCTTRSSARLQDPAEDLFDHSQCYITVRELAGRNTTTGQTYKRQIELNWLHLDQAGWIGLFDYDPRMQGIHMNPSEALYHVNVTNSEGSVGTDIELELGNLTGISSSTCHGYWIAFFQHDNTLPSVTNCYRLYPKWMNDLRGQIGDRPLHSIMIPGTHNAGAWKIYNPNTDDLISKITYTQEEDVWNQLTTGIRYLDIRVGYYPLTSEQFWVNHDVVVVRPLSTVLDSVLAYVQKHKEIVIVDFHRFPVGFTSSEIHEKLYDFVNSKIGSVLVPRSLHPHATPNQLWALEKYVVLTYNDDFNTQKDVLWPGVTQAWGETNQLTNLEDYLAQAVTQYGCNGRLWSAMAELTPKVIDVLTRTLRTMAFEVNKPATGWYEQEAWYSKSNIISTDFYEGNDVIEICVQVNRNRGVVC